MKPRSKSLWITAAACGALVPLHDGPGARLLRPDGEIGDQPQQVVAGADHPIQAAVVQPQPFQELARDRPPAVAPPPPRSRRRRSPRARPPPWPASATARGERVAGRRRGLLDVAHVQHRLGGQQLQPPHRLLLARRNRRARRPAGLQAPPRAAPSAPPRRRSPCRRRAPSSAAAEQPLLQALQVGQHQLGLDRLGVAHRIDRSPRHA